MTSIYFDVCCLNRPFDDQTQDRIRLEAEAVLLILKHIELEEWQWISSETVQFEIQQTPNPERRYQVQLLTRHASQIVKLNDSIIQRADTLQHLGFKTYDAMHLACAESVKVSIFLTTDDNLLKRANREVSRLRIPVNNPLDWLQEQTP